MSDADGHGHGSTDESVIRFCVSCATTIAVHVDGDAAFGEVRCDDCESDIVRERRDDVSSCHDGHGPRYSCRFYEWDDVGAPYGWHVLFDGVILDTYRDRAIAESYVRYMNDRYMNVRDRRVAR